MILSQFAQVHVQVLSQVKHLKTQGAQAPSHAYYFINWVSKQETVYQVIITVLEIL